MLGKISRFSGLVALAAGIILTAASCSASSPNPNEVMDRAGGRLAQLTSFHYQLDLTVSGSLANSFSDKITRAHLKLSGDSVNRSPETAAFTLNGDITADAAEGPVSLRGEMVSLPDYTYFRIGQITLPSIIPVALNDSPGWYKIRQTAPAVAADSQELGIASASPAPITPEQLKEVRKIIATVPLWTLLETFPDDTVNGLRAYHYRVKLESEALKLVAPQITKLLRQPDISSAELDAWSQYEAEIWIDKRSSNLTRIKLDNLQTVNNLPTAINAVLDITRHNRPVEIAAPKSTEEVGSESLLPKFPL
jgi:hypothetical protein